MSEKHIPHSSIPFDVQHDSELQITAPVSYIPLGSPAVRALLPDGNFRSREDALSGAKATLDALTMRNRIETLGVDSLTKLPTRKIFNEMLPRFLDRAKQNLAQGKKTRTALLYYDINNLKGANDLEESHAIGDEYIALAAQGLAANRRPGDFASRIGGDEIAEIIEVEPDIHEDGTLDYDSPMQRLIKNKRLGVDNALKNSGVPDEVGAGISVGYALVEPNDTEDSVLNRADENMYKNKPDVLVEDEIKNIESDPNYLKHFAPNNFQKLLESWFDGDEVKVTLIEFSKQKNNVQKPSHYNFIDITDSFNRFANDYPSLKTLLQRRVLKSRRLRNAIYESDDPAAASEKYRTWESSNREEMQRMLSAAMYQIVKIADNEKITVDTLATG